MSTRSEQIKLAENIRCDAAIMRCNGYSVGVLDGENKINISQHEKPVLSLSNEEALCFFNRAGSLWFDAQFVTFDEAIHAAAKSLIEANLAAMCASPASMVSNRLSA